jgi:hypothetical protein
MAEPVETITPEIYMRDHPTRARADAILERQNLEPEDVAYIEIYEDKILIYKIMKEGNGHRIIHDGKALHAVIEVCIEEGDRG